MSKLYESARLDFAKAHSESLRGHRPWSKGQPGPNRGRKFDAVAREHMSNAHKGKTPGNKGHKGCQVAWNKGLHGVQAGENHPLFGKHHSQESCSKMSEAHKGLRCYNNGIINIFARECPDGFVPGRLKRI
jgi:hypothetical protein